MNPKEEIQSVSRLIENSGLGHFPLVRSLVPVLEALGWSGSPRQLWQVLQAYAVVPVFGENELGELLAELGYRLRVRSWRGGVVPAGSLLLDGDAVWVCLDERAGRWHDGLQEHAVRPALRDPRLLLIDADPEPAHLAAPLRGWLGRLWFSARSEIGGILLISLVANVLTLAVSLFTMFVYNVVIPGAAVDTLQAMLIGALIAVAGAWGLRLIRVRLSSELTAWAGRHISDIVLRKTLSLPVEQSIRLGTDNNLIRLRSIESVRQWFGGNGSTVNADYPFVLIFLVVIAILGGWIVLVPLLGLAVFALVAWLLAYRIQQLAARSAYDSRRFNEMSMTLAHRLRGVRGVDSRALWEQHLPALVAQSAQSNRMYAQVNGLGQTVAQMISMLTVLATMGSGVWLVLAGQMSSGGLIATMMLIWRVTGPAQQMFTSQVRLRQLHDARQQLDRLLLSTGEVPDPAVVGPVAALRPAIELERVFYRYGTETEPALAGISFRVEPGQIVAIVGPNGAGKSTLLQMISGARQPQSGRIRIDGRDLRQFEPADFRTWLGYVPYEVTSLPLTLRETMKLRHPGVSDAQLHEVIASILGENWYLLVGAESEEAVLSMQISPWLQDLASRRIRFVVALATATLGQPPLLLLDDPLADLDPLLDARFTRWLESMRGRCTILLATHRPDLIQRADCIAILNDGVVAHFGPITATPTPV